jgi:hypothetical protein
MDALYKEWQKNLIKTYHLHKKKQLKKTKRALHFFGNKLDKDFSRHMNSEAD